MSELSEFKTQNIQKVKINQAESRLQWIWTIEQAESAAVGYERSSRLEVYIFPGPIKYEIIILHVKFNFFLGFHFLLDQ